MEEARPQKRRRQPTDTPEEVNPTVCKRYLWKHAMLVVKLWRNVRCLGR